MSRIEAIPCSTCGSQTDQLINRHENKHTAQCIIDLTHQRVVGEGWLPTLKDLFCSCGGVYIPKIEDAVIKGPDVVVMKHFVCPACTNTWSYFSMPPKADVYTHPSDDMQSLLSDTNLIRTIIQGTNEQFVMDIHLLRAYSEQPQKSLMGRLKGAFGNRPKRQIPPSTMPEKLRFLNGVRLLKVGLAEHMDKDVY